MSNEQIVKKQQEKTVAQVLSQTEETTFKDLKKQARKLIKAINNYFYKDFHKKTIKEQIQEISSNFHTSEYHILYSNIYDFEEKFNDFLGRKVFLTYISSTGQIIVADNTSAKKMYEGVGSDLHLTAKKSDQQRNINKLQQIQIKEIKQALRQATENKREVFSEAIRRWEKAPDFDESPNNMQYKQQEGEKKSKGYSSFYWFPLGREQHKNLLKWSKSVNKGHIGQAYVDAVMNREERISNDFIQTSLEILNEQYLQKQSDIAIAKGDVISKVMGDGRIQFAVKGNSAVAATFGQYLAFAEYLISLKKPITKENLQKKLNYILENNITVPQKILSYLVNSSEEQLYKWIKE